jgi:hypothetical protein
MHGGKEALIHALTAPGRRGGRCGCWGMMRRRWEVTQAAAPRNQW